MEGLKKIVIVGAGYGGVHAAKLLYKKFRKNSNVKITLIDKNPYHTLMTDLHEVACARVEPESVCVKLNKIFGGRNVEIVVDELQNIDYEKQELSTKNGKYNYDYLVLGLGSEPSDFGVPGVFENGFVVGTLDGATKLKHHIECIFNKASREKNPEKRKNMLTFVVAGAGFTGIETIGELAEWSKALSKDYGIDYKDVKLMVVEALDKILPILNDKLQKKAERYLKKIGVEVITSSPIVEVNKDSIKLKNGNVIKTNTLIWTCGVEGSKSAKNVGLTFAKRGRIRTNEYMQSVDHSNVYVIGDVAYYEENTKPIPQIVETALQTAETAVHNIVADIENKEKKPFKSNYHGFMVSIGSRYAVAELMGVSLSGFLAMAMKHLVNMHYLFGVAGINAVLTYIAHEFFNVKSNRSLIGGHIAAKVPTFWLVLLRIYVGIMWLVEGINKIQQGWLNPSNIFIITDSTSSATQTAAKAADTVSQATQAASQAATGPTPLLSAPPAFYKWFMNTFVAPHAFLFQAMVVLAEVGIGLALIAGLFTCLASLGSVFLALNFILSAMADKSILWYIFAAIALMGGAGRSFGLDYYVIPWLKNWWNKTGFAKRTYLYIS